VGSIKCAESTWARMGRYRRERRGCGSSLVPSCCASVFAATREQPLCLPSFFSTATFPWHLVTRGAVRANKTNEISAIGTDTLSSANWDELISDQSDRDEISRKTLGKAGDRKKATFSLYRA